MSTDELLLYLFDGQPHLLASPPATWLASSRRFREFVTTFRAKIRKKLRSTQDKESLYDLYFELETAYLLVQARALRLVYEPPCGGERCPDFSVTTAGCTLMLEVTRQRPSPDTAPTLIQTDLPPRVAERLTQTVCGKLGQLSKLHSNVLVVGLDAGFDAMCSARDLSALMLRLKQRAERHDPSLVERYGFRNRADFFSHYGRLSEVLVRRPHVDTGEIVEWLNPEAKRPLPAKVRTVLLRSHTSPPQHEPFRG